MINAVKMLSVSSEREPVVDHKCSSDCLYLTFWLQNTQWESFDSLLLLNQRQGLLLLWHISHIDFVSHSSFSFLSPRTPICPIGPAMLIRLETSAFLLLCKSAQVFDIAASSQWNYPTSPIMGNMWSLAILGLNFFPTCWHLNPLTCTSCLSLYIFPTYFFNFHNKASFNKSLSFSNFSCSYLFWFYIFMMFLFLKIG